MALLVIGYFWSYYGWMRRSEGVDRYNVGCFSLHYDKLPRWAGRVLRELHRPLFTLDVRKHAVVYDTPRMVRPPEFDQEPDLSSITKPAGRTPPTLTGCKSRRRKMKR
jgi:hypothetical protein